MMMMMMMILNTPNQYSVVVYDNHYFCAGFPGFTLFTEYLLFIVCLLLSVNLQFAEYGQHNHLLLSVIDHILCTEIYGAISIK